MNWYYGFSFFVMLFLRDSIFIKRLSFDTSQRTTFAPAIFTALAVAGKVILGIITSSP